MKTILSKFINKFTLGLYIALVNSVAFASVPARAPFLSTPAMAVGGALVLTVIGGLIWANSLDDDDDDVNVNLLS
ncbi:hypothetical protein ACQUW5_00350 [Legionella sp. CNM-1927-20]|uniref:hypothetical protein n=1 Tax=Legionella sp. CNM-1927-20 TaxID=3422221 RepID=UPI00403B23B4